MKNTKAMIVATLLPRKLRKALVVACGKNHGANVMGASLRTQEGLYKRMTRMFGDMPHDEQDEYHAAGREWWANKKMRGPGVDW